MLDTKRMTVTVEEAGALLGIGRNLAYQAVRSGEIPSIRIGKRLLVPRDALNGLLSAGASSHFLSSKGESRG